ncbi:MAG: VCBS repeat-containing protein [Planctomycetota bacterium]
MRGRAFALFVLGTIAILMATSAGCGYLYLVFGEGGLWPPSSGGGTSGTGSGSTSVSTSQPATIAGFGFSIVQLDPLLESTAGARVIAAADMNGDGLIDFVSGSAESQPIQVHLRTGAAVEFSTATIAGGAPISTMYDLGIADFNGDGRPDVAVLVNDTGFVPVTNADKRGAVVLLFAPLDPAETGNGLAWASVTINETFILPNDETGQTDFAIADMDGVNGPDIVLASNEITTALDSATKRVYLFQNPGGAAAENGGNWTSTTSALISDVPGVKSVKVADMDGDTDLDVVVTYPSAKSQNVSWLINPLLESGLAALTAGNWVSRTIGEQRELTQPGDVQVPGADFLGLGDIDGDGAIDAVVAHQSLGVIQWFRNPGNSVVQLVNFPWDVFNIGTTTTGSTLNQVQVVDLDLDGTLDVFITGSGNMAGFERRADVQDYWQPFTITGSNPVATIGKCAFSDVDGNTLLDIIAPMDRAGITNDQFLIIQRLTP